MRRAFMLVDDRRFLYSGGMARAGRMLKKAIRNPASGEHIGWLREHVHRYGAMYEPQEMMKRVTGEELNPAYFVRYVKEKFGAIYRL